MNPTTIAHIDPGCEWAQMWVEVYGVEVLEAEKADGNG